MSNDKPAASGDKPKDQTKPEADSGAAPGTNQAIQDAIKKRKASGGGGGRGKVRAKARY